VYVSSVRQIRPRVETFESALFAFRQADFGAAIQFLTGNPSAKASILRARALNRLGLFERSIGELQDLELENLASGEATEILTVMSVARIGSRTPDTVTDLLTTARTFAYSNGSITLEADVEFTTAVSFYTSGAIDQASQTLYHLLSLVTADVPWDKAVKGTYNLEEVRARAYDLLGHIAAREGRFSDQANFIYLAFAELDKHSELDHYIESQLLSNLAVLAADRDVDRVYEYVRDRVATAIFPGACRVHEFEIRRKLGLCASMRGDHVGALREFRRSSEIAPNRASKIKALLDRSSLANELNELIFANEESNFALDLSRQVDWSAVSSSEIFALLSMSQNLATRNPAEARRLFNLFSECKKRLNPFQNAATDVGFTGREFQADALIARGEGDFDRAVCLNLEAFELFKRVGYVGRAATVAVELFELTAENSYLEFAAAFTTKLPQSLLARRVNGHLSETILARKSPASAAVY